MAMPIRSPPTLQPPPRPSFPSLDALRGETLATPRSDAATSFVDLLVDKGREVNQMQLHGDGLVHAMLTGEDVNQAEVLTAVQKADLAFRMMLQIRNKLIEAYREVTQMQI
jgi:flagellar hook-basal body complex protein FliE